MWGILHIQCLEHPTQPRKPCQTDSPSRQPLHCSHSEQKRRELKMTAYEFTLKFSLQNAQADPQEYVELLGRNGCADALIGIGQRGRIAFSFTREATSAYEAVSSAIENIRKVLPNARLIEAAPDLVGLTETADLLGCTRQNMRQLTIRAGAAFPAPVRTGKPTIWHLSQILVWMNKNRKYEIDEALIDVAKTNMEVNLAIAIQNLATKSLQRVLSPI